jgi:hypothetical protein
MCARRDQRPNNVRYYAANRRKELERVRRRQIAAIEFLRELRRVPCADCGRSYLPYQMDFDHRDPHAKSFTLTTGSAMLKSRAALMAEAAKCDVVCANCHRVRTRRQHRVRLTSRPERPVKNERHRSRWRWHLDLLNQLRDVPCSDCGERYAPCAMEFDHRDASQKVQGVTRMIGRASIERILAEVDKCDIVCANCHRVRTFQRRSRSAA